MVKFTLFFVLIIKIAFGSINLNTGKLISQIIIKSYPINPLDNSNHFSALSKISFRLIPELEDREYHPNIGFGYKISKNLALEGSIFNKPFNNSFNQVISGGVQYFFGGADTLSWVTSIKKSSYNSIKDYSVNGLTFDISKWINFRSNSFRFGFGSSFYKKSDFLTHLIGQINFIFMNVLIPLGESQIGFGLEINQYSFANSLFVQKTFN